MAFKFNALTGKLDIVNGADGGDVVHNNTTSKQGGTTGEYYHLTEGEHDVVQNTSGVNTGDQDLSGYVEKAGDTMTGDLDFTGAGINETDYVDLNTEATASDKEGRLWWNDEDKTINLGVPNGVHQIGQEVEFRAIADGNISNGEVVYVCGTVGSRVQVCKAKADSSMTSVTTIAIATEGVLDGEEGRFTSFGLVRDLDTSDYAGGQELFLSAETAGAITTTAPEAPHYVVRVGHVDAVSETEGSILVNVMTVGGARRINTHRLDNASYSRVQDYIDQTGSAGWVKGGEFTDNGDGTMTVASGQGQIRETNSGNGRLVWFDWEADTFTPTIDTTSYIAVDYNAGSPQLRIDTTSVANGQTIFNLGLVFAESGGLHFFRVGQGTNEAIRKILARFNASGMIQLISGGIVAETGDRYLTVTSAVLYGGFTKFASGEIDTSGTDTFEYYYTDGAGGWQYLSETATQINNTQYDNGGTLSNLNNNRYRTDWVYLSNDGELLVMLGTNNSSNLIDAQGILAPTSLPPHIRDFSTLIAKIIVQEGNGIIEIDNLETQTFSQSGAVVHNETTGKQGGTTDEYYHLTAAEHGYLTGQDQAVKTTSDVDFNDLSLSGNATITGNLTVNGTEFITNTETVRIEDNLAIINYGETGAGITAGFAGWEADRGTLTNYQWGFDETTDTWRIGEVGDLQAVATREDSPTDEGVAYYDSTDYQFKTSSSFVFDGTNVGIGTDSPDSQLHIDSASTLSSQILNIESSTSAGYSINIVPTISNNDTAVVGLSFSPIFNIPSTGSSYIYGQLNVFDIVGDTKPSVSLLGSIYRARLLATANQEIPQTNILQIEARNNSTSGGTFKDMVGLNIGSLSSYATGDTYGIYQLGTADLNYFAGNVGIGTDSPSYDLEIEGGQPIGAFNLTNTASYQAFRFQENGATVGSLQQIGSTFATTTRRNNLELFNNIATGKLTFHTNNSSTPKMTIDASGNVGIGTTNPNSKLEVQTTTTEGVQAVTIDQNDADQAFIDFQGSSGAGTSYNINTTERSTFSQMIMIEVNGTKRWIKAYS